MPVTHVSAGFEESNVKNGMSIEEILQDYHTERVSQNIYKYSSFLQETRIDNTVTVLNTSGYEAYSVNKDNYNELSSLLNTDLSSLGLDPEYSYIVAVGGKSTNEGNIVPYSAQSEFPFVYNGTTYRLRYFYVTAADDPAYGKATSANVLDSKVQSVINNCLNTAISAYISAISSPLGTVASICGLDISKFSTAQTSTLYLNGGTNWTRVYTQVWSSHDSAWLNGSCVEYVTASSYMSGQYYSAAENRYVAVPTQANSTTKYSSNYNDGYWRNSNAVFGYIHSMPVYEAVGDVEYKYGGTTKITHRENF